MHDLYPYGYFFQQDKSSVHVATISSMKKLSYDIIDFPTYSPDLTPIENLWRALKTEVAKENPKTEKALCDSLRRNWDVLTNPENLKPYFENLLSRYVECIEKRGESLAH